MTTETIDLTPTWESLMPVLVEVATNGDTAQARADAKVELMRLAITTDKINAMLKKPPRIIVEVEGGCVTCIYGDPLPLAADFIVRDLDNIKEDPTTDPMKGETIENPVTHY